MKRLSELDTRTKLVGVAGLVAAVAGVVVAATLLTGGDDAPPPPPPPRPLAVTTPTALDEVFAISGAPAELSPADVQAITETVKGYLDAATVAPLSYDPESADDDGGDDDEAGGAAPTPPTDPAQFFTEAAAAQLETDDRFALTDRHLPFALHGVSTELAAITDLAALVDDTGSGQIVATTIDVRMVARLEDDSIVIQRSGELVLRPGDDGWRIAGYTMRVERAFTSELVTTTVEAAFG